MAERLRCDDPRLFKASTGETLRKADAVTVDAQRCTVDLLLPHGFAQMTRPDKSKVTRRISTLAVVSREAIR